MKKLICIFVCLCLCLLTACDSPKESPYCQNIQTQVQSAGKLIGVAYLGVTEGDFSDVRSYIKAQEYVKVYPFFAEISSKYFVENEGGELYCVLPADDSVTVSVYQVDFSENATQGELLFSATDGMPILLRGNVSDIMSNLMIVAEKDGQEVTYVPCISLESGLLSNSEQLIYDFSPYELMEAFNGLDTTVDWDFYGDWTGTVSEFNGETVDMKLSVSADGVIYSFQTETMNGSYTGDWLILSDNRLRLELGGETKDSKMPDALGYHTDLDSIYYWDVNDGNLVLTYINGTPLYPAATVTEFPFVPAE